MTLFDILYFNRELILRINQTGIRFDDCNYIGLYEDYLDLRYKCEKMTYIVSLLSERYSVSERKVYNIIKRFGTHCTNDAV